jgi:transcriptional regulator with AAA-type ATPase domain
MAADQPPLSPTTDQTGSAEDFRWQGFFQRCREPLFLLNRRRTILFVNHAWEMLTGIRLADARGLVCRRRREPRPDSSEPLQHALAPPPEAAAGKPTRARRLIPGTTTGPRWWDITYFPLEGPQGLLGILGRITAVSLEGTSASPLLPQRLVALRERLRQGYCLENLDSELPALRRVAEQVRLASQTAVPLLLCGEPGSGKEWIARTIHQEGPCRELTFAALDCARLPEAALDAVLFGLAGLLRRPGVGTVYFKEPSRMPRELQARLGELLQASGLANPGASGAPLPRILAGCGCDPLAEVRAGRLLGDLHYALTTLTIHVPPLRERQGDLPGLVERMLGRLRADHEGGAKDLAPTAWDVLRAHSWPGNLRELHTILAEAWSRAKGERIEVGDLPWHLHNPVPAEERALPLDTLLEQVERRLIVLALRKAGNNKTRAAEILSIWRPRLARRMEALGITDQEPGIKDPGPAAESEETAPGS